MTDPHNSYGFEDPHHTEFAGSKWYNVLLLNCCCAVLMAVFWKPHPIFKGLFIAAGIGCVLAYALVMALMVYVA